jgi:hypothetical protein
VPRVQLRIDLEVVQDGEPLCGVCYQPNHRKNGIINDASIHTSCPELVDAALLDGRPNTLDDEGIEVDGLNYTDAASTDSRLIIEEELRYIMKRGDDMFDLAVSGNMELNYVEDYKEGLREIVQESLQCFNFFEDDTSPQIDEQEGMDIDEENDLSQNNSDHEGINDASEEESSAESSKSMENSSKDRAEMSKKQKYKYQFKTNLFEADICDMKKRHKDFLQIPQSSDDESDKSATSYIGCTVKQHKHYQKQKFTKMTLCEKRATMELIASKCQKVQGEQVNRKRKLADNYKQVLQVGDIGAVRVPPNVQGSTDFPFLPIMVTDMKMSKKVELYGMLSAHSMVI